MARPFMVDRTAGGRPSGWGWVAASPRWVRRAATRAAVPVRTRPTCTSRSHLRAEPVRLLAGPWRAAILAADLPPVLCAERAGRPLHSRVDTLREKADVTDAPLSGRGSVARRGRRRAMCWAIASMAVIALGRGRTPRARRETRSAQGAAPPPCLARAGAAPVAALRRVRGGAGPALGARVVARATGGTRRRGPRCVAGASFGRRRPPGRTSDRRRVVRLDLKRRAHSSGAGGSGVGRSSRRFARKAGGSRMDVFRARWLR